MVTWSRLFVKDLAFFAREAWFNLGCDAGKHRWFRRWWFARHFIRGFYRYRKQ